MANSNSEDPKELQSDMFLMLDDNLQKGSEELRQWKICLNPYLQPVNLKETMSASEICSALLSKGSISLGDYSRLIKTVKKVDCPLADDILRQEQHIKDVMSSNKTASTESDKAFDTECNKTASTECDKTSSTECDGPYTNTKATVKHKVPAPVEDPKELQSDMFLMLDDNLYKGSEKLRQWKICLNPYLQPVNLKETMSASEICFALLSKGSISLGDYSRLIETVKKVDCPLADDILRQEQHIKDVMSSNKTASTECDKAFDTECNKIASTECDKTSSTECDGPYTNTKATVKHKVHAPVDVSLDLLFDFVASKLSNEMLRLAAELPLKRDHVDAIKHNNPNNIHEQNFQILYLWKCQKSPSDGECIERLKQALKENDRQDIVDDIDDFNKQDYRVSGICNPEQPVKDMDINKVATNINQRYTSLARFLGVPQRDLEQIQNDCRNDIREQAAQALNKWKRRSQTTRQWLCDGLNYANHRDIIDMLKEKW